ncbi:MAG: hypothetical protein JXB05_04835 [Myxococcaceae bacterium]|nr:hypothetical protein [Myxococcaceae bacterium]
MFTIEISIRGLQLGGVEPLQKCLSSLLSEIKIDRQPEQIPVTDGAWGLRVVKLSFARGDGDAILNKLKAVQKEKAFEAVTFTIVLNKDPRWDKAKQDISAIPKTTGKGNFTVFSQGKRPWDKYKKALVVGHASYQSGDMWHVAFAMSLYPGVDAFVFYDRKQRLNVGITDWKKAYRKAREYAEFYQRVADSNRTSLTEVDNISTVNTTLQQAKVENRPGPSKIGEVDNIYYISQSTHLIKLAAESNGVKVEQLCNHFRATCVSPLFGLNIVGSTLLKQKLDTYVGKLKEPAVLIWMRNSTVHPELNMTEEWFTLITGILDKLGYRWTCVGERMESKDVTPDKHPFVEFYKELDKSGCSIDLGNVQLDDDDLGKLSVEDKRYQVYLFDQLRLKGCISIGFRSGTLDGCSAFLGMPTFCLDNKDELGWERLAKFSMFFKDIYYTDKHGTSEDDEACDELEVALKKFLDGHGAPCWKGDA